MTIDIYKTPSDPTEKTRRKRRSCDLDVIFPEWTRKRIYEECSANPYSSLYLTFTCESKIPERWTAELDVDDWNGAVWFKYSDEGWRWRVLPDNEHHPFFIQIIVDKQMTAEAAREMLGAITYREGLPPLSPVAATQIVTVLLEATKQLKARGYECDGIEEYLFEGEERWLTYIQNWEEWCYHCFAQGDIGFFEYLAMVEEQNRPPDLSKEAPLVYALIKKQAEEAKARKAERIAARKAARKAANASA